MEAEEGGREPRPPELQPAEDEPEEGGVGGMEEDVEEVVAEGAKPPEAGLGPEEGGGERVVLAGRFVGVPDPEDRTLAPDVGVGPDPGVVVPDEPRPEDGEIGGEDEKEEAARGQNFSSARHRFRL